MILYFAVKLAWTPEKRNDIIAYPLDDHALRRSVIVDVAMSIDHWYYVEFDENEHSKQIESTKRKDSVWKMIES